jgi:hypothetical protein
MRQPDAFPGNRGGYEAKREAIAP